MSKLLLGVSEREVIANFKEKLLDSEYIFLDTGIIFDWYDRSRNNSDGDYKIINGVGLYYNTVYINYQKWILNTF